MRKSIKIVLVVAFGFIGVLFVGAWLSSPYVNQDVEGGLNQTNDIAGNQTVLPINSINTTSANGSIAAVLTKPSEQLQPLQQAPVSFIPAPFQPQQRQPSTLQQQQSVPPSLNVVSPSSQQQLVPPIQSSQQPSFTIPPPSTPLFPLSSFPTADPSYQQPVILSQYFYVDSIGTIHIVGEVLNQAPVTASFVKIIATFYDAYGQVIGTDFTFTDPLDLNPGQRAPFDMVALEGSVPMYRLSNYALNVDSR